MPDMAGRSWFSGCGIGQFATVLSVSLWSDCQALIPSMVMDTKLDIGREA
jgi:hypothetical protein